MRSGLLRAGLALGGACALLTACAGGDRVTLLPHSEGGPVGAVAVLGGQEGEDVVLNQENQQARLTRRGARVRQLDGTDPEYSELIASLPQPLSALTLSRFPTGEFSLSPEQIERIRQHLSELDSRPGYQIEIRGYTDSLGEAELNEQLSYDRARQVAEKIRELGFTVAEDDVLGMGEYEALRQNGDEVSSAAWRKVDVVIR